MPGVHARARRGQAALRALASAARGCAALLLTRAGLTRGSRGNFSAAALPAASKSVQNAASGIKTNPFESPLSLAMGSVWGRMVLQNSSYVVVSLFSRRIYVFFLRK